MNVDYIMLKMHLFFVILEILVWTLSNTETSLLGNLDFMYGASFSIYNKIIEKNTKIFLIKNEIFEQRIKQLKRTSKVGAQVSHMLKYNNENLHRYCDFHIYKS